MTNVRRSAVTTSVVSVTMALWIFVTSGGCKTTRPAGAGGPTQVDRLMQVYPELASGCFVVIADFENPVHMELVQLIGVSDQAACVLDRKQGREETGSTCLRFTSGSPDDTVVVSNQSATHWYLKRDWRDYDLLLMSVRSPQAGLTAEIAVASGPPDGRSSTHTSIPLDRGWNVVRLDLASIGEHIALDDVRDIRLAVSGVSKPVDIVFDDILLAANRADLLGDSTNGAAGLYVRRAGRRWLIGAGQPGANFELTFANGQFIEWFNTAADPHRLRNLVGQASLGPRPVVIGSLETDEVAAASPGKAVAVRSKIVEMNPVRVAVTSEWRFVDDAEEAKGPLDRRPFQRWVYTIYPTGQVYAGVEATAATKTWVPPQLGLAVTLASAADEDVKLAPAGEFGAMDSERPAAYATARSQEGASFLLYAVADRENRLQRMIHRPMLAGEEGEATSHTSLIAVVDQAESREGKDVETWACHLLLASADAVSDEEANARAADYASPVAPRMEVGSLAGAGPFGGATGFDPVSGCFAITPDRNLVRFVVDGRQRPHFSPAFQIQETAGREAWVYVDHLLCDRVARDAQGNLIFQLPGTIRKPTTVEVHLGPAPPPSGQ